MPTLLIVVESGIYQPAHQVGSKPTGRAAFMRKDASPCSGLSKIPDLEIENLPLNSTEHYPSPESR